MSKAVIRSNLDDETLSKTLEKGSFEDYSERYQDDGYHDYQSDRESVNLEVEINHEDLMDQDVEVDMDTLGKEDIEVAYQSKVVKRITNEEKNEDPDAMKVEDVKKVQEMQKKKKGFTVEDVIGHLLFGKP